MATQTVEFFASPSQTITAKLFAAGSDTATASVTATEATNRKGVYTAAYTDVAAGTYRVLALVGTTPVASWWVDLTLTTATFVAYEVPLGVFNSGDATQATLLAVKAKTDLITSGNISVLQDRVSGDTITMQYLENTSVTVPLNEDTTALTLQFVVSRPDGTDVLSIANGSIARTSTDFTVTINTAVTATLGQYSWCLRDITTGDRAVGKGVLTVQAAAAVDA